MLDNLRLVETLTADTRTASTSRREDEREAARTNGRRDIVEMGLNCEWGNENCVVLQDGDEDAFLFGKLCESDVALR